MCQELNEELARGEHALQVLAAYLVEMGADNLDCEIEVDDFLVEVTVQLGSSSDIEPDRLSPSIQPNPGIAESIQAYQDLATHLIEMGADNLERTIAIDGCSITITARLTSNPNPNPDEDHHY